MHLAWPAILQGMMHTLVFLVDRVMLGRYDEGALASMQISGPTFWSLISIFGAFQAGTVAVVGRAVGAGDADRARRTVQSVLALALGVGLLVSVGGFFSRGLIAEAVAGGGPEAAVIRDLAQRYMGVIFPIVGLYLMGITATTILQASGDTRTPMVITGLAGLVNVSGNYLLIYGAFGLPELGVVGAALGSAAAFCFAAVVSLVVLIRRRGPARLALERPTPAHREALGAVLAVSRAAFVEKLVFHAGFMAFVALISRLGDVAMAANQALIAIESLGFITSNGFGVAAGALVALKLGAGKREEAAVAGRVSVGLAVAVLSAVGLLFFSLNHSLIGAFTDDPEILTLGASCLLIAAGAQPVMAVADTLAGALRAAGDTRTPMFAALVGTAGVRVVATWGLAFAMGWGLYGVWAASTLDWIIRAAWMGRVFAKGRWKGIEV